MGYPIQKPIFWGAVADAASLPGVAETEHLLEVGHQAFTLDTEQVMVCTNTSFPATWEAIGGQETLEILAPGVSGATTNPAGNNEAGVYAVQYFGTLAGEPATVTFPYYLHFVDTSTLDEEYVIVYNRVASVRSITTALTHSYSAGSCTVAYAGPAVAVTAGLMSDFDYVKFATMDYGAQRTGAIEVAAAGAVMDTDFDGMDFAGTASGYLWRNGVNSYSVRKTNFAATADPTALDNSQDGYFEGSLWVNISDLRIFLNIGEIALTAYWMKIYDSSTVVEGVQGNVVEIGSATHNLVRQDIVVIATPTVGAAQINIDSAQFPVGTRVLVHKRGTADEDIILNPQASATIEGVAGTYTLSCGTLNGLWELCRKSSHDWVVTDLLSARPSAVRSRTVSGNTTLNNETDELLLVNTTSGSRQVTLPNPAAMRGFTIKKITADTNTITLFRSALEQIEGVSASYALPGSDEAERYAWYVVSDGTNWWVF